MAGFKSAFASARKAGKKEFTWNGKRYNTKLASGKRSTGLPKTAPVPTSREKGITTKRPAAVAKKVDSAKQPSSRARVRNTDGAVSRAVLKDRKATKGRSAQLRAMANKPKAKAPAGKPRRQMKTERVLTGKGSGAEKLIRGVRKFFTTKRATGKRK